MGVRELSARIETVRAVLVALDRGDSEAVLAFLTDDVVTFFGNRAPMIGKREFSAFFREIGGLLDAVRHEMHDLWQVAETTDVVVARLTVHYTLRGGGEVSIPCCNVFRLRDDLVAEYRVYLDPTPVFEPLAPLAP
jgi:ketosteroid isomerase-like protein